MTKRVLSKQLKELETHGIINKKIFPQLPPKVEYSLTPLGESLLPIIDLTDSWGNKNRTFLEKVIDETHPVVHIDV
ncbi:winged helix-turn-helix transcriptional regulator [Runella zeae]|uniref:winged helix-turn-helix transcriptional regulator n=1 Tax=Runella zeae TaxID=94255 RepID=UPI002354C98E|nr:helix-turn-helix domain-containing protein [Runella zeae]